MLPLKFRSLEYLLKQVKVKKKKKEKQKKKNKKTTKQRNLITDLRD